MSTLKLKLRENAHRISSKLIKELEGERVDYAIAALEEAKEKILKLSHVGATE